MARKSRRIVAKVLDRWGKILVRNSRSFLKGQKAYASGRTANSMYYEVFRQGDDPGLVVGSKNQYLQALDKGLPPYRRKGGGVGRGQFVMNIMEWMRYKGITPRSGKRTGGAYKKAAKSIINEILKKGTIQRFGYRGVELEEYLLGRFEQKIISDVAEAYAIEFTEEINIGIKKINDSQNNK